MEDRSIIKPILDALEYFKNSGEEINYFYNIIDKFCACWFGKQIKISKFKNIEYLLIHDLLSEYIRFEENNKRIALWLLAINRVCYNYTADITLPLQELKKINNAKNQDADATLIEPILKYLKKLDKLHREAGKDDTGQSDIISNFLQWDMIYTTIIYPSLENKLNFYENTTINAMSYILIEFIKQRSNDKRMAYLIMAILEACRYYSLQNKYIDSNFLSTYDQNNDIVIPGKEEALVEEILDRLKDENIKQRQSPILKENIPPEQYIKNNYDKFIEDLNSNIGKSVTNFNKYIFEFVIKFLSFEKEKQLLFLQTLYNYQANSLNILKPEIIDNLKKSINLLSDKTKNWLKSEIKKLENEKEQYIEHVIQKINSKYTVSKFNSSKLFIMVYFIKKLGLL